MGIFSTHMGIICALFLGVETHMGIIIVNNIHMGIIWYVNFCLLDYYLSQLKPGIIKSKNYFMLNFLSY